MSKTNNNVDEKGLKLSLSSSSSSSSSFSSADLVKLFQDTMIEKKKKYRRVDFDKSKWKEKNGVELFSFKIKQESALVVKVKGIFPVELNRCFRDFQNDDFMTEQDETIMSMKKYKPKSLDPAYHLSPCIFTKHIKIRSIIPSMTDDKDFELYSMFWENDKNKDKKEILSQTTEAQKKQFYKKKYLPIYDIFSQLKLETIVEENKDSQPKTEFLYIGVWEVANFEPIEFEAKVAESVQAKYISILKSYANENIKSK